ncbi:MAG: Hsp20/alpha crystallin family protein [Undibacterium sp.]|nr:Hsp20/alpha crystallin family protein [Opitutaceae bacterium]
MSPLTNILPGFNRTSAACGDACAAENAQTVRPAYKVNETTDAYTVTVQLPGVAKDGLEITAEDGQVRLVGRRAWKTPEGWTSLYRETADAAYELVLTHDDAIDAEKIGAELRDGVLNVTLPKSEVTKPRKIAVS